MRRRTFMRWASALTISGSNLHTRADIPPIRTRRSLADPRSDADVQAFREAVGRMLTNARQTDPHSWMYWANVHGMSNLQIPAQLRGIWATCDHASYFLAWHRMYLAFFESIIAEISGKADFAMPYWDWYVSADLPAAFEESGSATNALWRPKRNFSRRYAVSKLVFSSPLSATYDGFNDLSFGDPHSNIHLNFGGEMRAPSTAARDPIFWPHHAAMDRLWDIWLVHPRHVGPDPQGEWAQRTFSYLTAAPGNKIPVGRMLSAADLGYQYDTLELAGSIPPAPPRPLDTEVARALPLSESSQSPNTVVALSVRLRTVLAGQARTTRFPLPNAASKRLESVGSDATNASELMLVLDGVRLTELGRRSAVVYLLFINLPRTAPEMAASEPAEAHYVGQLNSFGLEHASHGRHGARFEFKLGALIPGLRVRGSWSPDQLEIHWVPAQAFNASRPLIEVGSVAIQVAPRSR
jgi:tyrosinase